MKTVILAGGRGSRLNEETQIKPKPMVEIGGVPILDHIMNLYSQHGYKDFILALGYLGSVVKDYFVNHELRNSDITVDLAHNKTQYNGDLNRHQIVRMIDTGQASMTGGRLHRLEHVLRPEGTFMLTYGDGLSNVDIKKLVEYHRQHGKFATVTAVHPPARFGALSLEGDQVLEFREKPQTAGGWINGGFFVFEPNIFDYLNGDMTVLEEAPLENLARDGQLMAYKHEGFWQPMDTMRDLNILQTIWDTGLAPWIQRSGD